MRPVSRKIARLFLATICFVLLAALPGQLSWAENPDFSKVDDMLNGRRNIGRADDLVIAIPKYYITPSFQEKTAVNNLIATLGAEGWNISSKETLEAACFPSIGQPYWPFPQQTRIARLFEQKNDVLVVIAPTDKASGFGCTGTDNMAIYVEDRLNDNNSFSTYFTLSPAQWLESAVADFDIDGYDDVLVMNGKKAFVATAKDVKTPGSGLVFGPWIETGSDLTPLGEPTVGDFNADGLLDVAWIGGDLFKRGGLFVFFATVCPGKVSGTICEEADPLQIILHPLSAQPIPLSSKIGPLVNYQMIPANALAAGDYLSSPGDELFVTYAKIYEGHHGCYGKPLVGEIYRFDEQMKSVRVDETVFLQNVHGRPNNVYVVSAPLKGFSQRDQAVVAWNAVTEPTYPPEPPIPASLRVVTFNEGSSMKAWGPALLSCADKAQLMGLAVGRFKDLPTSDAKVSDYELKIAVMFGAKNEKCSVSCCENHVFFYRVGDSPYDYRPIGLGNKEADFVFHYGRANDDRLWAGNRSGSRLRSGDLRGRSVRVGEPLVARINSHTQPQIILGSPPMHAAYVKPDSLTSKQADVINFSALWKTFQTVYDIHTTSTKTAETQSTTSYTDSFSESVGAELKFKIPYIGGPDAKNTETWKQLYENSIKGTYDTYKGTRFNASTATGFGDQIWYTSTRFNVYYYPVLGKRVCPAAKPDCKDEEKGPYYLVASGPDVISPYTIDGRLLEWYNPVHMPGNVFSYPATLEQLQSRVLGSQLLTEQKSFFTDGSTRTVKVSWSKGTGSDMSSGSSATHSFDTDSSLTLGTVNLTFLLGGLNVTGSFDYNKSDSTGTLFTTSTTLAASAGIAIDKPNGFLTPSLYAYKVTPAIFGQALPKGVLQDMSTTTDVQTHGVLQTLYAADPTDHEAGSWWSSSQTAYNQHIDVALNHPVRWEPTPDGLGHACLGNLECVTFNTPEPDNVWTSGFYHMRGLLVTVGAQSGPQRARAKEGERVFLRARVYNLSLKDMDPGTKVHARFYRQEWNSDNTPKGDSVLISEEVISHPLPGFNTLSNNWMEASTHFDTTGLGDTQWLFWVVVWGQDDDGNLVTELPGHGLATVKDKEDWKWITDVPLEEVTLNGNRTSFSNNVGVLKQAFYIEPEANEADNNNGEVVVEAVNVTPMGFSHNTPVVFRVEAEVVSYGGDAVNGVTVEFYNGDPDEEGVLFDVEYIAHLRRDEVNLVRIRYRPLNLGPQEIVVLARHRSETARGDVTFEALPVHR
jgi:hypothetical protein